MNSDYQIIAFWMDLVNRVVLPFIFMFFFSVLLIYSIFKSRKNVVDSFISSRNKKFQKLKRLAITSMFMNIAFISLELPMTITLLIQDTTTAWTVYSQFTYYVFYMSYSVNFYVMFMSNSLFRKEFFEIFRFK